MSGLAVKLGESQCARMDSQLITPPELGTELGVPERTLAQWRYRGIGPAYLKIGRHVRYDRREVDAWLRSQRIATIGGDAA